MTGNCQSCFPICTMLLVMQAHVIFKIDDVMKSTCKLKCLLMLGTRHGLCHSGCECTWCLQEAARLLRDRALDALKAAAVAQAESAQLRAQLMLSQPARDASLSSAEVTHQHPAMTTLNLGSPGTPVCHIVECLHCGAPAWQARTGISLPCQCALPEVTCVLSQDQKESVFHQRHSDIYHNTPYADQSPG